MNFYRHCHFANASQYISRKKWALRRGGRKAEEMQKSGQNICTNFFLSGNRRLRSATVFWHEPKRYSGVVPSCAIRSTGLCARITLVSDTEQLGILSATNEIEVE